MFSSAYTQKYVVVTPGQYIISPQQAYKFGEKGSGFRQPGEVQDFHKLRDKCLAERCLFVDPTFDAIDSNIYPNQSFPLPFVWKRPTELVTNPDFFVEGVSRFDVVQGQLGDCWLLAALSALTLNPKLFHQVVPEDQSFLTTEKYAGIFHFRFWQCGKWVDVVIDDRLPTYGNQLAFLHSRERNEFWSALLEKAYAKLHGSYDALRGGKTNEALVDFTGGLTEEYHLRNAPPNLFTIMMKAHERSSLMGCSIVPPNNSWLTENKLRNGLVTSHAYSITDVKLLDIPYYSAEKIQLLRIRNPWGSDDEWNGAWSDKSLEWDFMPESEKRSLGLVSAADGEFWMSYSDFITNFHELEICNLNPYSPEEDPTRSSRKRWESNFFEGSWVRGITAGGCNTYMDTFPCNPQYRIVLEDPDEDDDDNTCTLIVALMQKHTRAYMRMGARPLSIGYSIYKLDNPDAIPRPVPRNFFYYRDATAKVDAFTNLREVTQRFKLVPGTYCIIPSTYYPHEEGQFIVRVYSEKKNDMNENDREISFTSVDENAIKEANQHKARELIKATFNRVAGNDLEVDANELKEALDQVLKNEFDFPGFGINLCRGMVAMMDSDRSGKLGFEEFKELWDSITTWRGVFKLYDKTNTGALNSFELRDALASAGYQLNWHILKILTLRYANKNNEVSLEDFIMCAVKLKTMIEAFKQRESAACNEATFKLDEYLWIKKLWSVG